MITPQKSAIIPQNSPPPGIEKPIVNLSPFRKGKNAPYDEKYANDEIKR
jgi:hypothetical protein